MYDFHAIAEGVGFLFTGVTFGWLCVGFLLGFIVGAIPGFNDANLLAILLPFSLLIDPMNAIVAMSALYLAAQAVGAIPAILINIPGTPGTAATLLEGYPLAKKGKAGFAMGLSLTSSTIGGILGGAFALIAAPILGSFALKFGPAEMCLIGVFGMTIVGSLTGKNIAKGMLATLLGLLISLSGADCIQGVARANFGIYELYDGFPLIPTLLGLFGFSEMLFLIKEKIISSESQVSGREWKDIFDGVKEAFKNKVTLARSSILGFVIGLIPGVGAVVSGFFSYGQAKQWSKSPEKFGKGHPDGLVASDSANNATAAGAIVPVLTLGLPGSGSTMIMLVALMLHGLRPGPRFFLNFHAEAYTIMFSLFLSSILILLVGIPFARYANKLTTMPTNILIPIIGLLLFFGAFAFRFMAFDIILMIVLGIFAFILKTCDYPIPPVMLAIILGPIVEYNFLRAIRIDGFMALFSGPIVILLWVLTFSSLLMPILIILKKKFSKN